VTVTGVPLEEKYRGDAARLLARAFDGDPTMCAAIPDPDRRHRVHTAMFSQLISTVGAFGVVETTPGLGAVAIWTGPGHRPGFAASVRAMRFLPDLAMSMRPSDLGALASLTRGSWGREKALVRGPHWTLAVLGVEPSKQRFGLGAVLVRAGLTRADCDGHPVFTETSTEANQEFYRKLDFDVVEYVPAQDAPLKVPIWRMLYTPQV